MIVIATCLVLAIRVSRKSSTFLVVVVVVGRLIRTASSSTSLTNIYRCGGYWYLNLWIRNDSLISGSTPTPTVTPSDLTTAAVTSSDLTTAAITSSGLTTATLSSHPSGSSTTNSQGGDGGGGLSTGTQIAVAVATIAGTIFTGIGLFLVTRSRLVRDIITVNFLGTRRGVNYPNLSSGTRSTVSRHS